MPRQARLDAPGVLHHIMIRGIDRQKIFLDDRDRDDFLERLSKLLPQTETICYAWAFIPNHAHFLFRTGLVPLASLMRRLLTGYAVSFNHRHKRNGRLFQNRYKSIVCQEEIYLKELVRYIHLNPIRARIVPGLKELNTYPYCGHSSLMGVKKRPWQDTNYVLGYFGRTSGRAKKAYFDFMEREISNEKRKNLSGGGLIRSIGGWEEVKQRGQEHVMSDERILGDSNFVENLLSEADETYERYYKLKRLGYDVDRIAGKVSEIYDMDPDEFFSKGRQQKKVKARSLFCFWAVKELGMSLRDLARQLEVSPPAVGYSVERGEAIAKENGYRLIE